MTTKQVEIHAKHIINTSRARSKYIFLCEGDLNGIFEDERHSPSALRQLEKLPDSNFYLKCLNKNILRFNKPVFFNCGGRTSVIDVYNKIKELIEVKKEDSYVDLEKLYLLMDLDIVSNKINQDTFTEDVFYQLYDDTKIKSDQINSDKYIVTGLIHREAYLLLPKHHDIFDKYHIELKYNKSDFDIKKILKDIVNDSISDMDLKNRFDIVKKRISLSIDKFDDVADVFKDLDSEYLIKSLFTLRKVKPYWENITTNEYIEDVQLREQLSLEIAKSISDLDDENCHITAIFNNIIKLD